MSVPQLFVHVAGQAAAGNLGVAQRATNPKSWPAWQQAVKASYQSGTEMLRAGFGGSLCMIATEG